MKKTIILLTGIIVFSLSGLIGQSATNGLSSNIRTLLIQEKDPCIDIEDWMVDEKIWSDDQVISIIEEGDSELELQSWMIQDSIWD